MFDEQTPSNLPTGASEPEDMFSGTEPVAPSLSTPPPAPLPTPAETKPPLIASRSAIIVLGVVVGILLIGGVGYAGFRFLRQSSAPPVSTSNPVASEQTPSIPAPVEAPVSTPPESSTMEIPTLPNPQSVSPDGANGSPSDQMTPPSSSVSSSSSIDSDGDGLTDAEEVAAGTDSHNPDSDTDGLFDREEIRTYHTNPLNPDTDGDGYLDGAEVRNGYNPNGPGKLFEVPSR